MDEGRTRSWAEHADRLATATVSQFAYRLTMEKEDLQMLDQMKFRDFYLSLPHSEESTNALILAKHKKYLDFPKEYMQHYEIRNPSPVADLEIYPRGIILSSKIKEDISRSKKESSFSERLRAKLVKINQIYGPKVTFGKHGKHAFPSEIAYMKLLKDKEIAKLLIKASEQEPYFGFVRADYHSLIPRNKDPGWLAPKQVDWIQSFPVIIVPGIEREQLEVMVEKERQLLGIEEDSS